MNRVVICRLIGIVAMAVWSAVILWFYAAGRMEFYLPPIYLRIGALLGGLGLGVLVVFNSIYLRADVGCGHDHSHGQEGDDHDYEHEDDWDHSYVGNGTLFTLMVIPISLGAILCQDQFLSPRLIWNKGMATNTATVARRVERELKGNQAAVSTQQQESESWEYTIEDLEKVVDRSPQGNLMLTIDQLFWTGGDLEIQKVLKGQGVEAEGQVITYYRKGEPHPRRLRVFTLMVTCCVADAQPISIPVEFPQGVPEFEEMSWVKVSGTMIYPVENGQVTAILVAKEMVPTQEPYNDALY